jgi:hypothetical protein
MLVLIGIILKIYDVIGIEDVNKIIKEARMLHVHD